MIIKRGGPARVISDKRHMAQKVATVRKIKLRQETTCLGQIATVTAITSRKVDFRARAWDP